MTDVQVTYAGLIKVKRGEAPNQNWHSFVLYSGIELCFGTSY